MQRNTKRIIGKGVVCLLCFLLGGVATLGITWHLLGQDGRTLLQAHQLDVYKRQALSWSSPPPTAPWPRPVSTSCWPVRWALSLIHI